MFQSLAVSYQPFITPSIKHRRPNNFANVKTLVKKFGHLSDVLWISFLWYSYILIFLYIEACIVVTVETSEESNTPDGYYLVYYKHWSLTETGFFSQLICYITLFLFMVALLKCCHILIYDDSNEGLSVKADNGYVSGVL